jgi:hypothetical protein
MIRRLIEMYDNGSILLLQVAVLLVAVLLSVLLYIEPRLYWRDLWILLFAVAFYAIFLWLVLWAPRSARLASVGFVVGAVVEFNAMKYFVSHGLVRLTPGRWTPEGWYPLVLPAERFLIMRGWAVFPRSTLPGMFIGLALSGVAGCILAGLPQPSRR